MNKNYDDIINLPHYKSIKHPRMTIEGRSAQFAPFSALVGYEDAVKETERLTDKKIEIDDGLKQILNNKLQYILDNKTLQPEITFTYFVYDNNGLMVADGQTDQSGISPEITLPSMPTNVTQTQGTDFSKSATFYNVLVSAENFVDLKINNIPIFENIKTIQNFDLTFLGASESKEPQVINLPSQNTL